MSKKSGGRSIERHIPARKNRGSTVPSDQVKPSATESAWNLSPAGIATLDRKFNVKQSNPAFKEFSPHQFNPFFQPALQPFVRRVIKSGQPSTNISITGRRSLESIRPDQWHVSIYPHRKNRREVKEVLVIVQNDTGRKRLESKILRILESLPNATLLKNNKGTILNANIQAEKLFGYSRKELVGMNKEQLIPKRFRSGYSHYRDAIITRRYASQDSESCVLKNLYILNKEGREIPVEIKLTPIHASDDLQVLASFVDLTERELADARIKESQERFRIITDAMPVIVSLTGRRRGCTYVNKEGLDYFGVSLEKFIGFGWLDVVHPDDREECKRQHGLIFAARRSGSVEFRARRADGEYRWLLNTARPMFGTRRQFIGYICTSIDITEFKTAQNEMLKSRLELAHAHRVSAIGNLASFLAHELNQPLAAILSNAQAALRFFKNGPDNIKEIELILHDIVQDDKRAGQIIRRLRGLVKKNELEAEILQINDVANAVKDILRSVALEKDVRLIIDLAPDLPAVKADATQLQQVLLNLMVNGMDAMADTPAEDRQLILKTKLINDESVQLTVQDAGRGVPENQLETIFHSFVTTKKDGLGMGLSIGRSIIETHKGHLWAENDPTGGAIFYMTLPAWRG